MKRSVIVFVIACGVFAGTPRQASAQSGTWADRGYINIGGGLESGTSTMTDTRTSTIYEESATVTTSSTFKSAAVWPTIEVGVKVWKNLTVGAGFHQEVTTSDASISGSVPSPIFFNRPRTLNDTVTGLERKEMATHVMLGWVMPFGTKFDVMVFGGPSFFRLTQDVVNNVTLGEQGGAFTSVVAQSTLIQRKKSVTGYNAGVDATYIVWSNDSIRIGAGAFVRMTQASTDIEMLSSAQPTDVGGTQFGFGARIRF